MNKSLFKGSLLVANIFISFLMNGQTIETFDANTYRTAGNDLMSVVKANNQSTFYIAGSTDKALSLESYSLGDIRSESFLEKLDFNGNKVWGSSIERILTTANNHPISNDNIEIKTEGDVTVINIPSHEVILQNICDAVGTPLAYIQNGNEIMLIRHQGLLILRGTNGRNSVMWRVFVKD